MDTEQARQEVIDGLKAKEAGEPDINRLKPEDNGSGDLMSELRERRRGIGEDRTLDLNIPGYQDTSAPLVARYRRLEWEEIKKLADAVTNSRHPQKELLAQCDYIAATCQEIFLRKDGGLVPLRNAIPGQEEPIRYDDVLAEFLGFAANGSHRTAVLGVFNNEMAIPSHHVEIGEWMESSRAAEAEDFTPIS